MNLMAAPRIGDGAPDFLANSTEGELRLSTWLGSRWLLLLYFPAAFTPVSVSEMQALDGRVEQLLGDNVAVLGVTPDTVQAQLAWLRDLRARFGVSHFFPFISDADLQLSMLYGVLHPGASRACPVRASFILDPKRTVRASSFYPLANGRSVDELLRLLAALRASDEQQAATPAKWVKGERMLAAPPTRFSEIVEDDYGPGEDFYHRAAR